MSHRARHSMFFVLEFNFHNAKTKDRGPRALHRPRLSESFGGCKKKIASVEFLKSKKLKIDDYLQ